MEYYVVIKLYHRVIDKTALGKIVDVVSPGLCKYIAKVPVPLQPVGLSETTFIWYPNFSISLLPPAPADMYKGPRGPRE